MTHVTIPDEVVIWYPSGDYLPTMQRICELRNRGYLTITADRDERGQRYYAIGQGPRSNRP